MLSLTDESLLTDTFPPNNPHNNGARILRLGLAISAYAALEKYIEACFQNLMSEISQCKIGYSSLPDKLRRFILVDAVHGLANRLSFTAPVDREVYVAGQLSLLASYSSTPATYTALGFSPRGPNVGADDVASAFSSCGLDKVWSRLSTLAHEISASRLSLKDDYENLAKTRHRSAHQPHINVPTSDLKSNLQAAIVVGIVVDVLACGVAEAYRSAKTPTDLADLATRLAGSTRRYRFVDQQPDGRWVERASASGKAIKKYVDESAAVAGAQARPRSSYIILRNVQKIPIALV